MKPPTRTITIPVTIHAPLRDIERLEAIAQARGMSRAAYVKELIRADLAQQPSAADEVAR